jgi:uncharacterized SAM-binding protein YcdF (DUF218 family)
MIEGGALGIALWCVLFALRLLPGLSAATEGVLLFGLAGMAAGAIGLLGYAVAIVAVLATIVVVVTQTPVSDAVAAKWIRCDAFPDSGVAAAVVLSAGLNSNSTMNREALDNFLTGLELTTSGTAPVLVATTVQQRFPNPIGVLSSQAAQSRIVTLLGREVRMQHTPPGTSTRDEAVLVAALLFPQGIANIAVVASPLHTRRACSAFEAVGFRVTCVPALSRSRDGTAPRSWPADRLSSFGDWVYELAATAKYRMNGWLAVRPRLASSAPARANRGENPVASARQSWCE